MESEPIDSGGQARGAEDHGPTARRTGFKAPVIGLLALTLIGGAIFLVGIARSPGPAGGTDAPGIPPPGSIWFGSSFDPAAGLSGRLTTVSLQQRFSAVAHLTQPMDGSELRVRTWWEGKLETSNAADATGTLAIWDFTPEPPNAAGEWTYDLTDVSGIVLASGTITATGPAAALVSTAPGSPGPTAATTPAATPSPSATPSPAATAPPETAPSPAATARPSATAPPTRAPTPRPTSNRYALLTACPGTPDCWVYTVRPGDNLYSIARYFGVSLAAIERRNPWTTTTHLVAGRKLVLPTPTR